MLALFKRIRQQTEYIVSPLQTEDFVAQPIVDVSPPKWHLGHTTWFFENFILIPYLSNYQLFNEDFAFIFNSYYESQGKRILRNKRGTLTRPATSEIYDYRHYVDRHIEQLLQEQSKPSDELMRFLEIGINHEQQHQELLVTDIKYILGSNPLHPTYSENINSESKKTPPLEWLKVNAGNYQIGYNGERFHFDNEKGVHTVYLHDFECMSRLVSNGEFIEFIEDDAYARAELWQMEAWEWVKQNEAQAPLYWFKKSGKWMNYRVDGIREINQHEPVTHINYYEAEAFARWRKMRLLTEQEWEVVAQQYGAKLESYHFQEAQQFHPQYNNSNQLFGTAWEWTNSAYLPYPFYHQEEGALGEYNGKFMINQMVLRGGSCATPQSHFRPTYRNFFHPHLQWQFTGIRLAKSII